MHFRSHRPEDGPVSLANSLSLPFLLDIPTRKEIIIHIWARHVAVQIEGELLEAKLFVSTEDAGLRGVTLRPLFTFFLRGQLSLVCLQGDKPSSNHGLVGCSI